MPFLCPGKPLSSVKAESSPASGAHLLDFIDFSLLFHKSERPTELIEPFDEKTAFQHHSAEFKLSSALHKLISYKVKPSFSGNSSEFIEYCDLWRELAIRLANMKEQSSARCLLRVGILAALNGALGWILSIVRRSSDLGQDYIKSLLLCLRITLQHLGTIARLGGKEKVLLRTNIDTAARLLRHFSEAFVRLSGLNQSNAPEYIALEDMHVIFQVWKYSIYGAPDMKKVNQVFTAQALASLVCLRLYLSKSGEFMRHDDRDCIRRAIDREITERLIVPSFLLDSTEANFICDTKELGIMLKQSKDDLDGGIVGGFQAKDAFAFIFEMGTRYVQSGIRIASPQRARAVTNLFYTMLSAYTHANHDLPELSRDTVLNSSDLHVSLLSILAEFRAVLTTEAIQTLTKTIVEENNTPLCSKWIAITSLLGLESDVILSSTEFVADIVGALAKADVEKEPECLGAAKAFVEGFGRLKSQDKFIHIWKTEIEKTLEKDGSRALSNCSIWLEDELIHKVIETFVESMASTQLRKQITAILKKATLESPDCIVLMSLLQATSQKQDHTVFHELGRKIIELLSERKAWTWVEDRLFLSCLETLPIQELSESFHLRSLLESLAMRAQPTLELTGVYAMCSTRMWANMVTTALMVDFKAYEVALHLDLESKFLAKECIRKLERILLLGISSDENELGKRFDMINLALQFLVRWPDVLNSDQTICSLILRKAFEFICSNGASIVPDTVELLLRRICKPENLDKYPTIKDIFVNIVTTALDYPLGELATDNRITIDGFFGCPWRLAASILLDVPVGILKLHERQQVVQSLDKARPLIMGNADSGHPGKGLSELWVALASRFAYTWRFCKILSEQGKVFITLSLAHGALSTNRLESVSKFLRRVLRSGFVEAKNDGAVLMELKDMLHMLFDNESQSRAMTCIRLLCLEQCIEHREMLSDIDYRQFLQALPGISKRSVLSKSSLALLLWSESEAMISTQTSHLVNNLVTGRITLRKFLFLVLNIYATEQGSELKSSQYHYKMFRRFLDSLILEGGAVTLDGFIHYAIRVALHPGGVSNADALRFLGQVILQEAKAAAMNPPSEVARLTLSKTYAQLNMTLSLAPFARHALDVLHPLTATVLKCRSLILPSIVDNVLLSLHDFIVQLQSKPLTAQTLTNLVSVCTTIFNLLCSPHIRSQHIRVHLIGIIDVLFNKMSLIPTVHDDDASLQTQLRELEITVTKILEAVLNPTSSFAFSSTGESRAHKTTITGKSTEFTRYQPYLLLSYVRARANVKSITSNNGLGISMLLSSGIEKVLLEKSTKCLGFVKGWVDEGGRLVFGRVFRNK